MSTRPLKYLLADDYPQGRKTKDENYHEGGFYESVSFSVDEEFRPTSCNTKRYKLEAKRKDKTFYFSFCNNAKNVMRKVQGAKTLKFVRMTITDEILNTVVQSGINLSVVENMEFTSCKITAMQNNLCFFLRECSFEVPLKSLQLNYSHVQSPGPIHYWLPSTTCPIVAINVTGDELFPDEMLEEWCINPVNKLDLTKTNTHFTVASILKLIMTCFRKKHQCFMNFGQIRRFRNDTQLITKAQKQMGIRWRREECGLYDKYTVNSLKKIGL